MRVNKVILPDKLLLFDGVCNLCDRSVQFVIRHDPEGKFKFAALQSAYAKSILSKYPEINTVTNKDPVKPDSIIFILNNIPYIRSSAVLKVMATLGFPYNLMSIFYILPGPLRDTLYNYIASHRYRWYGKKESCMVPTATLKARFMDQD